MNEMERAKALFEEGIRRFAAKDFSGAEKNFHAANDLAPCRASVLSNLAASLLKQGKFGAAEEWAQRALQVDSANFETLLCLGACCEKTGRWETGLAHYRQALLLRPSSAETLSNMGIMLTRLTRHDEALDCLDKAIAASPQMAEAWINRGHVLNNLGRYEEALTALDRAVALNEGSVEAWYNRGNSLANLVRHSEAMKSYDKALTLAADHVDAHFNKSLLLLDACEFEQGWDEYEWRWKSPGSGATPLPSLLPRWNGAATGSRLLVWAEQGVGDEILYSTMLDEARTKVGKLTALVDRRLLPLFERSFADIEFLPKDFPLPPDVADIQISMGGLARFLRTKRADFPSRSSRFLKADSTRTRHFKSTFGNRRAYGVSWLSKNQRNGIAKSIRLKDLLPVLRLPGVVCVDLQYGDTSSERAELMASDGIAPHHFDELDTFNDLDGLASLIDACEVVITTSNLTVHIAGALGKPTHLLVPFSRGKIWYWHRGDSQSLWYPSVRLYQQAADGAWDKAISRLVSNLGAA
jgi:tetratricopeptide (TPR) repeat protein